MHNENKMMNVMKMMMISLPVRRILLVSPGPEVFYFLVQILLLEPAAAQCRMEAWPRVSPPSLNSR